MGELEKRSELRSALATGATDGFLSLVPFLGPAVAGMISGASQTRWWNRVYDEVENIEERISALEGRVHRDFVHKEEFHDLVAEAMPQAARTASEERRALYGSVVVAAAIMGPGSQVVARRMLRRIEALDPIHFQFLKAIAVARDTGPIPGPVSSAHAYFAYALVEATSDSKGRDRSVQLLEDLIAEGLISPDSSQSLNQSLQTTRSAFSAKDARRWISKKGWETLTWLWPEDERLAEMSRAVERSV